MAEASPEVEKPKQFFAAVSDVDVPIAIPEIKEKKAEPRILSMVHKDTLDVDQKLQSTDKHVLNEVLKSKLKKAQNLAMNPANDKFFEIRKA